MITDKRIGNAQTIGAREVQSNYFSTTHNNNELLALLCDGSIDHPNGRIAAVIAAQLCRRAFLNRSDYISSKQFLFETAAKVNQYINDHIYIGKIPHLSLCMALLSENKLRVFNVGVNRVLIFDGYNEYLISEDIYNEYEITSKHTIEMLSNGSYITLHPMERILILETRSAAQDKALAIIQAINAKNLDNQQNATVVLVEGAK